MRDRNEPAASLVAKFAFALRDVLAGEKKSWRGFLDQTIRPAITAAAPDARVFSLCAYATQLARLAGDKNRAAAELKRAGEVYARLPQAVTPMLAVRATHHRNALELGNKNQQQEAREFFRRHVDLGYRCFAHLI